MTLGRNITQTLTPLHGTRNKANNMMSFLDIIKMSIAIGCPHFFKRFHGFRLGSFEVESSAVLKEGLGKSNLGIGLSKFRFSSSFS